MKEYHPTHVCLPVKECRQNISEFANRFGLQFTENGECGFGQNYKNSKKLDNPHGPSGPFFPFRYLSHSKYRFRHTYATHTRTETKSFPLQ